MDPLSATASIVAVVGAAGSLASGLRKICALKDAPDDLRQLYEDLSYIHLLVSIIQDTWGQRDHTVLVEDQYDELIYITLRRSSAELLDIEKLIAYDLTKVSSNGDKLDKMAWLRAQGKVQSAQARLRETRSMLTGILNVSQARVQSASIRLSFEEFSRRQEMCEELMRRAQVMHHTDQRYLTATDSIVTQSNSVVELTSRFSAATSPPEPSSTSTSSRGEVGPRVSQAGSSHSSCFCSCHRWNGLRSPKLLRSLLGFLAVSYDSLPFIGYKCDNLACRNHLAASFHASYVFPQWFTQRTISIRATSELRKGPELLLRVLRVCSWDHKIFNAFNLDRMDRVRSLLSTGAASVLDVNPEGVSLLNYAINGNLSDDAYLLLTNAGADVMQEDHQQVSPYVLWWTERRAFDVPAPSSLVTVFGAIPEAEDLSLPELTASICGLSTKPFDVVLQSTPRSEVDELDRMGRSALFYAAQHSDFYMVKELLMKGADPNLQDYRGFVPLSLWAYYHPRYNYSPEQSNEICGNMLDLLGTREAVNHEHYLGFTVSHRVMLFHTEVIATLERLKALGADFEDKSPREVPLLANAIRAKYSGQVIAWLLANGCNINCRDLYHGRTPTMFAVRRNRYEALKLLLERGSDYAPPDKLQRSLLHYAAIYAGEKTLEVLRQHSLERLRLDAKDEYGNTPLFCAQFRRDHNIDWSEEDFGEPDEDPLEWYNSFIALYRHIAESQGLTYIEELDEEDITEDSEWETEDDSAGTSDEEDEPDTQISIPGSFPAA